KGVYNPLCSQSLEALLPRSQQKEIAAEKGHVRGHFSAAHQQPAANEGQVKRHLRLCHLPGKALFLPRSGVQNPPAAILNLHTEGVIEKLVGENRSFCGQYWHGRGTLGQISSLLRTSKAKRTFVPKDQKGGWPARDNRRKLGGNSSGCTSFRVADSGLAPQR